MFGISQWLKCLQYVSGDPFKLTELRMFNGFIHYRLLVFIALYFYSAMFAQLPATENRFDSVESLFLHNQVSTLSGFYTIRLSE